MRAKVGLLYGLLVSRKNAWQSALRWPLCGLQVCVCASGVRSVVNDPRASANGLDHQDGGAYTHHPSSLSAQGLRAPLSLWRRAISDRRP
jgi:hypothetical protein